MKLSLKMFECMMTENWVFPLILSKTGLEFDLVGSNFWPELWPSRVFHTGGQIAGSLAVVSDAAHILGDLTSFLISLFSLWLTSKPPTKQLTFGWHRAGSKHVIVRACGMERDVIIARDWRTHWCPHGSAGIQRQCTNAPTALRTRNRVRQWISKN